MSKKMVFTFGRYNPPTVGHSELINYAVKLAHRTGAEHRIYTSQSHDSSKNPLTPRQKMTFLRQVFPGVNFVDDPSMKTAFHICKKLAEEGYEDVVFVVGDDRVAEFSNSLGKYVKPRTAKDFDPKKHYPFKKFKVESSGARKKGISGTDLRAAVRKGDFATFAKASAARDKTLARKIFDATRKQLSEEVEISEVTSREMHKHLTSKGWTLERKGKSHDLYTHPKAKNGRRITLPRHPGELDRRLQKEIDKQTDRYIREEKGMSRKDFHDKLMSFVDFTCNHLGIDEKPTIQYKEDGKEGCQPSFASYSPSDKVVSILTKNRHPMDVFRSIAHELVHHKQNLDGRLGKNIAKEGATGSKIENEANSEAGKVMRYFGKENPFYFDMSYITEKAIILAGTPGSGKDKILKEAILPFGFTEVSADNFHNQTGNLVVNGTSDYNTVKEIKEALELKGYETMMVFVNTSNEVSKQRNEARASKGGRVITETVRFSKWKGAQDALDRFDQLFEKVIEVKNDLDLNLNENVIKETYDKLINNVSKEISDFALNEMDRRFERMLNEMDTDLMPSSKNIIDKRDGNYPKDDTVSTKDWRRDFVTTPSPTDRFGGKTPETTTPKVDTKRGEYGATPEVKGTISTFRGVNRTPLLEVGGAGNWGTQQLTDRYKADTPGQEPGKFAKMKVLVKKMKTEDSTKRVYPSLPIGGDRIGDETGLPKGPGFGDNQTIDLTGLDRQIDRWMVKEETRKRFKAKYGALSDQKIQETAVRLAKMESLDDPFSGTTGGVSSTGGPPEDVRYGSIDAEREKLALFGKKNPKKTK